MKKMFEKKNLFVISDRMHIIIWYELILLENNN